MLWSKILAKKVPPSAPLLASLPTILASMGWAEVGLAFSLAIITVLCLLSRGRQEDTSPILNVEEQGDEEVFVQKDED